MVGKAIENDEATQENEEMREIVMRPTKEQKAKICDACDVDEDASPTEIGDALLLKLVELLQEEDAE